MKFRTFFERGRHGKRKRSGGIQTAWICGSLGLACGIGIDLPRSAHADGRVLIDELGKLKATLPVNDPQRTELSLRIADRLVDEGMSTKTNLIQAAKDRTQAIALYVEVLPKIPPSRQTKVRFQMARLYLEQNKPVLAQPLLEEVYRQDEPLELKRESALRLAEINETKNPGQAEVYYTKVLEICQGTDACSYARYRMAWIKKNRGDLPGSISEMKLALWDSKGQIREEALRDLVSAMGSDPGNFVDHAAFLEVLATKTRKPDLLKDLAFSYLGAGNKAPAVQVLKTVLAREPSIELELKYLEELYGIGPWEQFQAGLDHFAESVTNPGLKAKMVNPSEAEKVALRLSIQLDGDRATRPERTEAFQGFAVSTLTLFPKSKERLRLIEGWVASEKSADAKLARLATWIHDPEFAWTREEKSKLLELRVGLAQHSGHPDAVIADLTELQAISPKREYRYAHAYALYTLKDYAKALPIFQELAIGDTTRRGTDSFMDKWSVQSQNLALDILNRQKNLSGLQAQAKTWLDDPSVAKNAALAKDVAEMREISAQAEFEQAVALGETDVALAKFRNFCEAKRFTPKSCENAKILAVKMNRHEDLLSVLKVTGPASELAAELENGGYFKAAGEVYEKDLQAKEAGFGSWIKVALLYELGEDIADRNRVLAEVMAWSDKRGLKPSLPEEKALSAAMAEAGVFEPKHLQSKGSPDFKARVAESLESRGKGSAGTRAILLAQKESTGPAWDRAVTEEVATQVKKERSLSFHGKNGERKFQERVAAIQKLGATVDRYSAGASAEVRASMLSALKESHAVLASEILASPIPGGLTSEQAAKIREGLAEMAKPFRDRAGELAAMLKTEVPKQAASVDTLSTGMSSAVTQTHAPGSEAVLATSGVASGAMAVAAVARPDRSALIRKIHENPQDAEVLASLRDSYRADKKERPALYFEGRLKQLQPEVR